MVRCPRIASAQCVENSDRLGVLLAITGNNLFMTNRVYSDDRRGAMRDGESRGGGGKCRQRLTSEWS